MNVLQKLIYFSYLTNYDIGFINSNLENIDNIELIQQKFYEIRKFSASDITRAIEETKIAIDKLNYYSIKTVSVFDKEYPEHLRLIKDSPPLLYYKGKLPNEKQIAIVGSRKTSKYAKKLTSSIADWVNELGYGIVSGLAMGIDTYAHQKAIINGKYTLAVLPNSLDSIYPKENYSLANMIIDNDGCLISELIFGINRGKKSFVQRNRIQAALSDVVIPVEMSKSSGTMHTINFAKRYSKKIFVFNKVPDLDSIEYYSGIEDIKKQGYNKLRIFNNKEEFFRLFNESTDFKLDL